MYVRKSMVYVLWGLELGSLSELFFGYSWILFGGFFMGVEVWYEGVRNLG